MMLATIRPDSWNVPLFVHVAGAMLLVGSLVVAAVLMRAAVHRGEGAAALTRLGLRVLLLGVLPAYVVMRASAEWIAAKEPLGNPSWIGIGYSTADGGLVLVIVASVLAWRATRRGADGAGGPGRAVVVVCGVLIAAYCVAIWAMTTKPS